MWERLVADARDPRNVPFRSAGNRKVAIGNITKPFLYVCVSSALVFKTESSKQRCMLCRSVQSRVKRVVATSVTCSFLLQFIVMKLASAYYFLQVVFPYWYTVGWGWGWWGLLLSYSIIFDSSTFRHLYNFCFRHRYFSIFFASTFLLSTLFRWIPFWSRTKLPN